VEPEFIERLLAGFTPVVEAHIHHVAANTPGILGKLFGGYFLLDGTYSALRSLQERTSFHAYILTFDETVACLVDEPATTPIRAIREVQEMLQNNPGAIEADVSLSGELRGENLPQRMETLIRSKLSVEDNARLRLVFHHRGKVLKQKTVEPE
jgi:hypothetical protein